MDYENETYETVFSGEFNRYEPESFVDFCARMVSLLESIPEHRRASAVIEFDAWDEWGVLHAGAEVKYIRPKTDDDRSREAKRKEDIRRDLERRYEALGRQLGKG